MVRQQPVIYAFGDFELDTDRYELRENGVSEHVEPQVFDVLVYLITHRERVVARDELLAQVWGHEFVSEATLSSRVMAARKAVGDSGKTQSLIRTVRGRGYQFVGTVTEAASGGAPPTPVAVDEAAGTVGREVELAELTRLLGEAIGGVRRFVLVTGEAGAGKTTLVERFVQGAVREGPLLIASGRCLEQRGAVEPFMPVLEALGQAGRRAESQHVAATLSRLAPTWLAQMPGLRGDEASEDRAERVGAPQPERMLREIAEALDALGTSVPVVLVLDDLHWADASTLALLSHVARRDQPARLMIIGIARSGAGTPIDALRRELAPSGRCVELALPLFAPSDVRAYIDQRYPGAQALAGAVHRRTDGNPMFIDCLLRSWVDAGALERENDAWHVRGDERDLLLNVPDTLRELLEQDFERLAADDQRTLEVASVVGSDFSAAAVAAGLELDVEEVEARCAELARRSRFVHDRGADKWPDGTVSAAFRFAHDLHRQVLYERIPAGRRARLHGGIASRLVSGYGAEAPERAAELAAHYLETQQSEAAVRYLQLAAEQALARGGQRDAVSELTTALELVERTPDLPDRDRRELSLQSALSGALIATEGWTSGAAERAYRRGLELARKLGDSRSASVLLFELASMHEYRGEYPASSALIDEALRVGGAEQDAARLLEAHEVMSCSLFHQGSFDAAVEQADRGLALYQRGQRHPALAFHGEDPAVSCNDWAGLALWCLGHPDQALERISAALELAAEPGRDYGLASARMHAARLHQLRREPEPALDQAEATVALAGGRGFTYQAAAGLILHGWALTALGSHGEGIDRLREGLDAHQATGAAMDRPYFLALLAEGLEGAGRPEEGLTTVDDALELLGGTRAFFFEAELHRLHGALTLRRAGASGTDRAESSFRRALDVARRQGARSLELRAVVSLTRLMHERGAGDDELGELRELSGRFGEAVDTPDLRDARALIEGADRA